MEEITGKEIEAKIGFTRETVYRIGFWFLVIYLVGFLSGILFAQKMVIDPRLKDAVKLGGIVINNSVYDLKPRP